MRRVRGVAGRRPEVAAPRARIDNSWPQDGSKPTLAYVARTITFTASAGVPATDVALTRSVTDDAVDAASVTRTLRMMLPRAGIAPVDHVPAFTLAVTLVAPRS